MEKWDWLKPIMPIVGMVGLMLTLFAKGRPMKKNIEKLRDALRFATDAAVPRVQAEATILLAEVCSTALDDLREERDREVVLEHALAKDAKAAGERAVEELRLLTEIHDMLGKAIGVSTPGAEPTDDDGLPQTTTPEE